MEYRTLGRTGLEASAVGLGAWEIGGAVELTFEELGTIAHGWGTTDDAESLALVERCRNAGVNFIDTAPSYGAGHSEELIGRALSNCRDDWIVCTKGGHGATDGIAWNDFGKQRLVAQIDESLGRLAMDHVDVYLLHGPTPEDIERGDCLEALEIIRRQGKARYVGASIGSNELGVDLIERGVVDVLQQTISIVHPGAATALLPAAVEANVGIVARGLFGAGFLTGTVDADTLFDSTDRRSWQADESKRDMSAKARSLRAFADERRSLAQLAVQYVLQIPGISTVIPGTSKWAHMQENVAAVECPPLSPAELAGIANLQSAW